MNTIRQLLSGYLHLCLMLCLLIAVSSGIAAAPLAGAKQQNVTLANGTEIPVTVFPGRSNAILLWLPSENGLVPAEFNAASEIAKSGVEVWLADLHTAYFLPIVPSSLQQIPADDVAQLIAASARRSGKKIYLVSEGNGAALALTAAAALHDDRHDLRGAILLSPNLYVATPEPGEDAQYLPVTTATHLPLAILQPELSPWRWHLDQLQALLNRGGASVAIKLLPKVRDRFYFRDDALPAEQALAPSLPQLIINAYKQLGGKQP